MYNFPVSFADYSDYRPAVWKSKDIELLKKQVSPFARKFEIEVDEKILDLIDEQILKIGAKEVTPVGG
jgi:hypothetical protein